MMYSVNAALVCVPLLLALLLCALPFLLLTLRRPQPKWWRSKPPGGHQPPGPTQQKHTHTAAGRRPADAHTARAPLLSESDAE